MLLYFQVLSMQERTKGLSLWLQNVKPHSEMLDVLSGILEKKQLNYTTCQITRLYRRSAEARLRDFSPPCETVQKDFEISPEATMPECHANLFLTQTLLQKARNRVQLAHSIPVNLGAATCIPSSAD